MVRTRFATPEARAYLGVVRKVEILEHVNKIMDNIARAKLHLQVLLTRLRLPERPT